MKDQSEISFWDSVREREKVSSSSWARRSEQKTTSVQFRRKMKSGPSSRAVNLIILNISNPVAQRRAFETQRGWFPQMKHYTCPALYVLQPELINNLENLRRQNHDSVKI